MLKKLILYLLLKSIKIYQLLFFNDYKCKYWPSCSNYSKLCLERFGIAGLYFASKRLLKCHPFNPFSKGGIDQVPEKVRKNAK